MALFDWYRPAGELRCPACGRILTAWQGKDGPCGLFVWQEGVASPIEQEVDDELRIDESDRIRFRLPHRFVIYTYDCPEHQPIEADCVGVDGRWHGTFVRPFEPTK
jgi:hypothetical protein